MDFLLKITPGLTEEITKRIATLMERLKNFRFGADDKEYFVIPRLVTAVPDLLGLSLVRGK